MPGSVCAVDRGFAWRPWRRRAGKAPTTAALLKGRPAGPRNVRLRVAYDGSAGWLPILPTGQVYVNGAASRSYLSLASISFPVAATKWINLKLATPWRSDASQSGTGAPAYAVIAGIVYLTGSMHQPTPGSGLWAVLPAAARTKADVLDIEVDMPGGSTGGVTIAIAYPQNS